MATYTFKKEILIHTSLETMWSFLSNPKNLQQLTPKSMGGKPLGDMPEQMVEGMEVEYRIQPFFPLSLTWRARFPKVVKHHYFIDEQIKGPFKSWQHKHTITSDENGVRMMDEIVYEPPFGIIGAIANKLFIRKQLQAIFDHRTDVLKRIFPET
ncbi:MAG: SRPBCC family protein [Bacteroidia bacterium]|nr:SRPBCC family protein [Bacteroidia bacterium]